MHAVSIYSLFDFIENEKNIGGTADKRRRLREAFRERVRDLDN